MKIIARISIGFFLFWTLMYQAMAQDGSEISPEILAEFPNYPLPSVPIFIPEGESLPIYDEHRVSSNSRFISGEGHLAIAQHCERSVWRNRSIGEHCEERWIQILDVNGGIGWILYDYTLLSSLARYDSHFIPYRQRLDSIDSPVTLYAYPNDQASVIENLNVEGYAFVYGFDYDETGVWYLAKYTLGQTGTTITAWVHLSFPESYHWYSPMPDLPHAFITESPLAAQRYGEGNSVIEFNLEAGELVFLYHQAVVSGYYEFGQVYNGDWRKFIIPVGAINFPIEISRRVSMQMGE